MCSARFRDVKLTPEPVIDISGASGVPMILALAEGRSWAGHVPGPVRPAWRLSRAAGWRRLEPRPAAVPVAGGGDLVEHGATRRRTASSSGRTGGHATRVSCASAWRSTPPCWRRGFPVSDLEEVYLSMHELRTKLQNRAEFSLSNAAPSNAHICGSIGPEWSFTVFPHAILPFPPSRLRPVLVA